MHKKTNLLHFFYGLYVTDFMLFLLRFLCIILYVISIAVFMYLIKILKPKNLQTPYTLIYLQPGTCKV
ncbi:MAG: hypothetical protein B6I19_09595 [Bacteroidetes bacterium 4572_114]|nr:MAG: hypothetical protein B6I19_09595 [Bacteroidetes bacterium 4572_114]